MDARASNTRWRSPADNVGNWCSANAAQRHSRSSSSGRAPVGVRVLMPPRRQRGRSVPSSQPPRPSSSVRVSRRAPATRRRCALSGCARRCGRAADRALRRCRTTGVRYSDTIRNNEAASPLRWRRAHHRAPRTAQVTPSRNQHALSRISDVSSQGEYTADNATVVSSWSPAPITAGGHRVCGLRTVAALGSGMRHPGGCPSASRGPRPRRAHR